MGRVVFRLSCHKGQVVLWVKLSMSSCHKGRVVLTPPLVTLSFNGNYALISDMHAGHAYFDCHSCARLMGLL